MMQQAEDQADEHVRLHRLPSRAARAAVARHAGAYCGPTTADATPAVTRCERPVPAPVARTA